MSIYNFNGSVLESWWSLLKHLNRDIKLELAGRLIESLKNPIEPKKKENDDWLKLFGAWSNEEETAEDLIEIIRSSRVSTRQIESFD